MIIKSNNLSVTGNEYWDEYNTKTNLPIAKYYPLHKLGGFTLNIQFPRRAMCIGLYPYQALRHGCNALYLAEVITSFQVMIINV